MSILFKERLARGCGRNKKPQKVGNQVEFKDTLDDDIIKLANTLEIGETSWIVGALITLEIVGV